MPRCWRWSKQDGGATIHSCRTQPASGLFYESTQTTEVRFTCIELFAANGRTSLNWQRPRLSYPADLSCEYRDHANRAAKCCSLYQHQASVSIATCGHLRFIADDPTIN